MKRDRHGEFVEQRGRKSAAYRKSFARTLQQIDLAMLVREMREAAGFTQTELAKKAGTTQSVIARLEDAEYPTSIGKSRWSKWGVRGVPGITALIFRGTRRVRGRTRCEVTSWKASTSHLLRNPRPTRPQARTQCGRWRGRNWSSSILGNLQGG